MSTSMEYKQKRNGSRDWEEIVGVGWGRGKGPM